MADNQRLSQRDEPCGSPWHYPFDPDDHTLAECPLGVCAWCGQAGPHHYAASCFEVEDK